MFDPNQMEHAVDLQAKSYKLLKWLADAVQKGFISFKAAHAYSSLSAAAEAWIGEHYLNLPADVRPRREDINAFSALFSTYLENSFDLVSHPGQRLYSPRAHCFCPMCSWLVDAPNLQTKKPTTTDKKRAHKMMMTELARIASEHQASFSETETTAIVDDQHWGEKAALCAYGTDLLRRMRGNAVGPASLVLWRRFAWLPAGSPRKNFKLSASSITGAEIELRDRIVGAHP